MKPRQGGARATTARATTPRPEEKKHEITIVSGVCGLSVYLNGYRIAGDKPWGGGTTVKHWESVDDADVRAALKRRTDADSPKGEKRGV